MKKKLIKKGRKKKGFTLIELLAVILILGIIALIAIPTVNNVVEQARKGAYEDSVSTITKAIEQYALLIELSGEEPLNGVFLYSELANKLDLKGDYADIDGYVEISNGRIINYSFSNDKYVVSSNGDKSETYDAIARDSSVMNRSFPYKTNYKTKIVNVLFTYGTVPSDVIESWSVSSDDKIFAYVKTNHEDNTMVDLYVVSENNIVAPKDMTSFFHGYTAIKQIKFFNFDTSNTTNMTHAFDKCEKLENINLEKFNVGKVTNFSFMFYYCKSMTNYKVNGWDMSSATNISQMFHTNQALVELDLSGWDVRKVEYTDWMFCSSSKLENIIGLDKWNLSSVKYMAGMFSATRVVNLDLRNWDTKNVTCLWNMFNGTPLKTLDISTWDTSNVDDMRGMFGWCSSLTKVYVGDKWTTAAVTKGDSMFTGCSKLPGFSSSKIDYTMANWDTGYLTYK